MKRGRKKHSGILSGLNPQKESWTDTRNRIIYDSGEWRIIRLRQLIRGQQRRLDTEADDFFAENALPLQKMTPQEQDLTRQKYCELPDDFLSARRTQTKKTVADAEEVDPLWRNLSSQCDARCSIMMVSGSFGRRRRLRPLRSPKRYASTPRLFICSKWRFGGTRAEQMHGENTHADLPSTASASAIPSVSPLDDGGYADADSAHHGEMDPEQDRKQRALAAHVTSGKGVRQQGDRTYYAATSGGHQLSPRRRSSRKRWPGRDTSRAGDSFLLGLSRLRPCTNGTGQSSNCPA